MAIRGKGHPLEWIKNKIYQVRQRVSAEFGLIREYTSRMAPKKPQSSFVSFFELQELKWLLKQRLSKISLAKPLTLEDKKIISEIHNKTTEANRNNVTRTHAYAKYYMQHPEVHWANLAHMVSRNAGWNMTDLKNDILPRLLHKENTKYYFNFLERCNWLIFQDAYPQLLLYEKSKNKGRPLFHLLPYFHVSVFMETVWHWFWDSKHSKVLTLALITNEQNYIQSRVVENEIYQETVLNKGPFRTQAMLHMNQVFFPYLDWKTNKVRLVGTIMEDFNSLTERIEVGKRLYAMLFELDKVSPAIHKWGGNITHTGSRTDYWPHIFSKNEQIKTDESYSPRLEGDHLHSKAAPIYSPSLEEAWGDVHNQLPPSIHEWCHNTDVIDLLKEEGSPFPYDLTREHLFSLNRLELAVMAQGKLFKK